MATPPTKRLSQLDIDEVSLVDAAAVRDADDPTQPMRFYAYKREGAGNPDRRQLKAMDDEIILTADEEAALIPALQVLEKALQKAGGDRALSHDPDFQMIDDLDKQLHEMVGAERNAQPVENRESYRATVSRLARTNSKFARLSEEYDRRVKAGPGVVTKSASAQIVRQAAEELVAKTPGLTIEKAEEQIWHAKEALWKSEAAERRPKRR